MTEYIAIIEVLYMNVNVVTRVRETEREEERTYFLC